MNKKERKNKEKKQPFIKKMFRSLDFFGQEITLNFKQNGNKYTTVAGGFFSSVILVVYFLYFSHNLNVLMFRGGNTENSYVQI